MAEQDRGPDPATVMAKHQEHGGSGCYPRATTAFLGELPHCLPYLLAQRLRQVEDWANSMVQVRDDNQVAATCRAAGRAVLDLLHNAPRGVPAGGNRQEEPNG